MESPQEPHGRWGVGTHQLRLLWHPRAPPLDTDLEDVGTLVEKPSKDL